MRIVAFQILVLFACGCDSSTKTTAQPTPNPRSATASSETNELLRRVLKVGDVDAKILEMEMPPEAAEIMDRFSMAIAAHPEGLQEHLANHSDLKPGEPLPYHRKMGISEDEYNTMVAAKSETRLVPTDACTVSIRPTHDTRLMISGTGRASALNGLIIDTKNMLINYKGLQTASWAIVTPKPTALVLISGVDWNSEEVKSDGDVSALSLTIGEQTQSGKAFLEFSCTKIVAQVPQVMEQLYLEWDLK